MLIDKEIGLLEYTSNTEIKNIIFGENVLEIPVAAFSGCRNLKSISFKNPYTKILSNAFECCTSLTNVELPPKLEELASSTFEKCISLKEITFPPTLKCVGESCFNHSGLEKANLENIEIIKKSAFAFCNFKELAFSKNCKNYESFSFAFNKCLKKITFPKIIDTYSETFAGCKNIETIILPEKINGECFLSIFGIENIDVNNDIIGYFRTKEENKPIQFYDILKFANIKEENASFIKTIEDLLADGYSLKEANKKLIEQKNIFSEN